MTENKKFDHDSNAIDPKMLENKNALLVVTMEDDPINYHLYPIKIKEIETVDEDVYADNIVYKRPSPFPNRLTFDYSGSAIDPIWWDFYSDFYSKMRKWNIRLKLNDLKKGFLNFFK